MNWGRWEMKHLCGFVATTLAIAAFGFSALGQAARVTGKVRDSKGVAVAGAQVSLQGTSYSVKTRTDPEGNFAFDRVSATRAQIVVTARGMESFQSQWVELSVLPGNLTMYPNIVLRKKRGLCGIRCWIGAARGMLHASIF